MTSFNNLYVKYIVKSKTIYVAFLAIGVTCFIIMSLNIKIALMATYDAQYSEGKILINKIIENDLDYVYFYKSRNDRLYKSEVTGEEYFDGYTVFHIDSKANKIKSNISGNIKVDMVTGYESLFKLIFAKAGLRENIENDFMSQ